MNYIRGTRYIHLILSANGSGVLNWWIGVSYAVHLNMQGHTGGGIYMGIVFTILNLKKQMLNTHSSSEPEIVGVHNCMPAVCWTRYF